MQHRLRLPHLVSPRALFEPHLPAATRWRFLRLERHDGVAGLVRSYARALDEQLDTLDPAALVGIADNFARLLAIACGGAAREHGDAVSASQLTALKQYIARNLASPELSPASVAAASHQERQRATVRRPTLRTPDNRRSSAAVAPCCIALTSVTIVAR
jgi:hypothetical protein